MEKVKVAAGPNSLLKSPILGGNFGLFGPLPEPGTFPSLLVLELEHDLFSLPRNPVCFQLQVRRPWQYPKTFALSTRDLRLVSPFSCSPPPVLSNTPLRRRLLEVCSHPRQTGTKMILRGNFGCFGPLFFVLGIDPTPKLHQRHE